MPIPEMKPDRLCVIVRGFHNGAIVFETRMIIPEVEIENVAEALVREHAAAIDAGRLGFVEIETPEETGPSLRIWRDSDNEVHCDTFDPKGTVE